MSDSLMTFAEALSDAKDRTRRISVILGNGFSIEWDPQTFHYQSLHEEATLKGLSVAKNDLFEALDTYDFEAVVDHLEKAAELADLYEIDDKGAAVRWDEDAEVVRNGLADVLAARHPDHAGHLSYEHENNASKFLSEFGSIYTLNYDLLLYWVLNSYVAQTHDVPRADGFEYRTAYQRDRLVWKRKPTQRKQRVFYLHGAMHMFVDPDRRLRKLRSEDGNLIDQIRDRVLGGEYPLIVSEGKSKAKIARIDQSAYLTACHESLATETGALFIHGLSLHRNDIHIRERIAESSISSIYLGIHRNDGRHGGSGEDDLRERARSIKDMRKEVSGVDLSVSFYDALSADVWHDGD